MYISFRVLTCWLLLLSAKGLLSSVVGEPFEVPVMMVVTGKFPVSCLSSTEYTFSTTATCAGIVHLVLLHIFAFTHSFQRSKSITLESTPQFFMMTKSITEHCNQTKNGETGSENVVLCIAPNVLSIFISPQLLACSTTHGKKALFRKLESNTGGGDGGIFPPPQG